MNKILLTTIALGTIFTAGAASAETYLVSQPQSRYIACYSKEYVPAKVLVNTRGILVAKESKAWEVTGDSWNKVRNPAVYIETRRVVEADHYKLVAVGCP